MDSGIKSEKLPIRDVVKWLRTQDTTWWAVDGDRRLESRLEMPATNQAIADALERLCEQEETLEVLVPASKQPVKLPEYLDGPPGRRRLTANGGDDGDGWILIEQTEWVEAADAEVEDEIPLSS